MSLERRLAWRNVWRNGRRTGLCVTATVFSVFLVVLSVAMADGTHEKMIEDGARLASGHVTVSAAGYLENRTLEYTFAPNEALSAALDAEPRIVGWAPRVASFALLSNAEASRGAAVIGVDPDREGQVTTLPERVRQGRFLAAGGTREVVLGQRLAEALGVAPGDELLVYGVAYSLETAYELFTVVGTMRLPQTELERTLALISLDDAREFFVLDGRLSEVAVLAESADDTQAVRASLQEVLGGVGGGFEVYTWDELMPELANLVFLDDAGMYLMLVILVIVVGFGILNTILMAILERQNELGMMMALGLRARSVFRLVYWESILMASIGLVIGLALSLPLVVYLSGAPIPLGGKEMQAMTELFGMEAVAVFKLTPQNPIGSALTILVVGALAALYPARKASRSRPIDALRTL